MIQKAFGDDVMSTAQIKVQHKSFKDGWESVASDTRSGKAWAEHLRMLNVHRLQSTKIGNWLQKQEADLGIPKTTESEILSQDLGMKCVVAKFIPWLLLPEQK